VTAFELGIFPTEFSSEEDKEKRESQVSGNQRGLLFTPSFLLSTHTHSSSLSQLSTSSRSDEYSVPFEVEFRPLHFLEKFLPFIQRPWDRLYTYCNKRKWQRCIATLHSSEEQLYSDIIAGIEKVRRKEFLH
jgi:hypothetical protein